MMFHSKSSQGFSLIELMIVLAIMGVAMSLTGGLVIQAFEKNKRQVELERVKQAFKVYGYRSFYSGYDTKLELVGNTAVISSEADEEPEVIEFESLTFVAEQFHIGQKLTIQPATFGVFINEQPRFYDVPSVLEHGQ
ncbi:type II secretion system protein [Pseudoalteromonas sp. PS5]|uniref:type II secretion system protein n=1 Tax=Pseudoalteromonas sp. PS5 TaxID=1437473 RepID=UPI000FFEFA5F|nr:type II secretion system protein [Pseudoalteromonas sp. PS5]RXF02892.1 type II secretion system protein [Pseudoalteromonas sp. PS5]